MRISDWSSDVCSSDLCQAILKFADDKGRPMPLPAYDQCMKASHAFNLLDARGVISVTERQAYIGRVRALAKACCEAWVANQTASGPGAERGWPRWWSSGSPRRTRRARGGGRRANGRG